MAVVAFGAVVALSIGVATLERHRAAAAADAAALQAALASVQGSAVACREGGVLALRNGARLTRCVLDGSIAEVEVEVRLPGPLAALGPATGRARAGPASVTRPG
jgi:secretion/DNA translocation related TadE-like protein